MRAALLVFITAACALADTQNRRTKLPYIADAVGNSLPPPSSVPATVGSPVNLLTPDRYEFYTFDESGELVKRLMTLEEIQAIVAAGEETEGLVTFANDNQPTIAFNFTQPSQTKVHSVVTNVQNVLKAQMEAHKNKPNIQPTLDTPDVSDSWSLILPSIFGNTGVDIVPDKTSGSFITPETETFEMDNLNEYENSQNKEKNEIPTISTIHKNDNSNKIQIKDSERNITTSSSTTTSSTSISMTTSKPGTTVKLYSTTTKTTTQHPVTKPISKHTTSKPSVISSSPTAILTTPKTTSTTKKSTASNLSTLSNLKPNKSQISLTNNNNINTFNITKINDNLTSVTNGPIHYEKISTYLPISTVAYITEKTTHKPVISTKKTTSSENNNQNPSATTVANRITTTLSEVSLNKDKYEKLNATTMTTQSVSPSTIASSTLLTTIQNNDQIETGMIEQTNKISDTNDTHKENEPVIPIFDVAQSISQIATDLGNNFVPIPTSNSLLDTTKTSMLEIESKENLEIDIPTESGDINEIKINKTEMPENFVKISTFDPQEKNKDKTSELFIETTSLPTSTSTIITSTSPNIMDAVISESMGDLLSQVVHDGPDSTSIIFTQNNTLADNIILTSQNPLNLIVSQELTKSEPMTTTQILISTTIGPQLVVNNLSEVINKPVDQIQTNITQSNIDNNKYVSSTTIRNDGIEIKTESNTLNETTLKSNLLIENVTKVSIPDSEKKVQKIYIFNTSKILENSSFTANPSKSNLTTNTMNYSSANNYKSSMTEKIAINDNNINNKFHKHKITEELPKIDEFKKKIQKVNIDDKELANERNSSWKLISTVTPSKTSEIGKDKNKAEGFYTPEINENKNIVLEFPKENQGLEVTTKDLGDDILQFTELSNELAFRYWNVMTKSVDKKRSIVFSPYSITSMLAMMFMGAKGATSGEMNEVLKLDDMVTFNPHFTLKNISDSIETTSASGVAISAFIRELYSERSKGKLLTFYKERAQHFYNGHVEEISFKLISDVIRRRTNLLVKRYTWGRIHEFLKTNSITMNPPLAAFSANLFYTDCTGSSIDGRDGEMYFVVSPNVRQRRLVPVPAVVYKSNFLAGYDPVLDATAAALGNTNSVISTLFLMPGQQGNVVHADDLENLEKRFIGSTLSAPAWNGLLRTLLPRIGLELQIPRFSHKSIFNVSTTLRQMGLKELFDADHADLGGLNGPSKDLYLSDMLQLTSFVTCGEGVIADQHHIEEYPEVLDTLRKRRTSRWITGWDEPRDYQRAFHDPHDVGEAMHLPLHLRPRQARLPARSSQPARLKFDRPFLFFVRHNPSGMILYVGRYNPRLLP